MSKLFKKWSIEKKTLLGLGSIGAILIFLQITSLINTNRSEETSNLVAHTYQVKENLENLIRKVIDTETGARGYLLTGEEKYLEPYKAVISQINPQLEKIKILTADNPIQQESVITLKDLVASKLESVSKSIDLRRNNNNPDAVRSNLNSGKQVMDRIRSIVYQMSEREEVLLKQRLKEEETASQFSLIVSTLGIVINVIFLVSVYFMIKHEMSRRRQSERVLWKQNQDLEQARDLAEASTKAKSEFLAKFALQ